MVTIDIMGLSPKSAAGNTHILVASDYFTRWVEAYAIPNLSCSVVPCYLSLTGQINDTKVQTLGEVARRESGTG